MVLRNQKKQRLEFTSNLKQAVSFSNLIFICVGTPKSTEGSADLTSVFSVVDSIVREIKENKVVVIKSTVPPGTGLEIQSLFEHKIKNKNLSVQVALNPEFLREGRAINDFMEPDRVIIGAEQKNLKKKFLDLYSLLISDNKIIFMDMLSAELTKYASNAMLATKISFINEIANISDFLGADIDLVRKGIGSDKRIGFSFINPGPGYGGSCFPKDVRALEHTARELGYQTPILSAVEEVNQKQKASLFTKLSAALDGDLSDKTVAVWGLAFKPNTDDMREAPSRALIEAVWAAGGRVRAYDPEASQECLRLYGDRGDLDLTADRYQALEGADALVICTEWKEFRVVDAAEIKARLRRPLVIDGRNLYDPLMLQRAGIAYFAVGRGDSVLTS